LFVAPKYSITTLLNPKQIIAEHPQSAFGQFKHEMNLLPHCELFTVNFHELQQPFVTLVYTIQELDFTKALGMPFAKGVMNLSLTPLESK
jgi:hypothetical protein